MQKTSPAKPHARKAGASRQTKHDRGRATTPVPDALTFSRAIETTQVPTGTRERILHAAVEILNTDGFGYLTQQHVAERAGVRQSHITYYFPVRNDLLRETAVYACNALLSAVSGGIASGELTPQNFRSFLIADASDRRFARLMAALVVASDEDDRIKPWLASFEAANREQLFESFRRLGFLVTSEDIELFHAAYVGAVLLDLGESSDESMARSQRIVQRAFDLITARPPKQPAQNSSASARKRATK
jgi:AcrR family transcriptional regulator